MALFDNTGGDYTLAEDSSAPASSMDQLNALLSTLPNYSTITPDMKQDALNGALIPDYLGVWPGQVGYVPTYDVYFAATRLLGFLRAQPVVRQSSSEGTSVSVDAPSWGALIDYYSSMSPIAQATGTSVLNKVLIPDARHVDHVNMSFGGDGSDNVDTDVG